MPEMKTLNGYEIVDAKAREDIETLKAGGIPGGGGTVDLTGYATEEYVDNAIASIDIPEVDFTGYATEDYVDTAIDNIEHPEPAYSLLFPKTTDSNKIITDEKTIEFLEKCRADIHPAAFVYAGTSGGDPCYKAITRIIKTGSGIVGLDLYSNFDVEVNPDYARFTVYYLRKNNGVWQLANQIDRAILYATSEQVSNKMATKQDKLVSGCNIKTINGESILGEGDLVLSGGGAIDMTKYYTKTEIDNMFDGIATAEGGAY